MWACWCVHRVRRVHMDMPVPLPIHTRSCSCYLLAPPGRESYSFPVWPLSSLSCLCPESLFCPTPFSHHSSSPIFSSSRTTHPILFILLPGSPSGGPISILGHPAASLTLPPLPDSSSDFITPGLPSTSSWLPPSFLSLSLPLNWGVLSLPPSHPPQVPVWVRTLARNRPHLPHWVMRGERENRAIYKGVGQVLAKLEGQCCTLAWRGEAGRSWSHTSVEKPAWQAL